MTEQIQLTAILPNIAPERLAEFKELAGRALETAAAFNAAIYRFFQGK